MGVRILNDTAAAGEVTVDFETGAITMEARDALEIVNFPEVTFTAPACASLRIEDAADLGVLDLSACAQTQSIVCSSCPNIGSVTCPAALNATEVDLSNASLSGDAVEAIYAALTAGTGENGTLNLLGGSNSSTVPAEERDILQARGWTIADV